MKHSFVKNKAILKYTLLLIFNIFSMEKENLNLKIDLPNYFKEECPAIIVNKNNFIEENRIDYNITKTFFKKVESELKKRENIENLNRFFYKKYKTYLKNQDINICDILNKKFLKKKYIKDNFHKEINNNFLEIMGETFNINEMKYCGLFYLEIYFLINTLLALEENKKIYELIINNEKIKNFYEIYKKNLENYKKNDNNAIYIVYEKLKSFFYIPLLSLYEVMVNFEDFKIKFYEFDESVKNKDLEKKCLSFRHYQNSCYDNSFHAIVNNIIPTIYIQLNKELIKEKELRQKQKNKKKKEIYKNRKNRFMENKELNSSEEQDEVKNLEEELSILSLGKKIEELIPSLITNRSLSKKNHNTSYSKNKYLSIKREEKSLNKKN